MLQTPMRINKGTAMSDTQNQVPEQEIILAVDNVAVDYPTDHGVVHAVRGVSYVVHKNEMLAIVGESGCGKSQSSYAAMGLIQEPGKVVSGEINFYDEPDKPFNLLSVDKNSPEMRSIRGGKLSMIFQEPMTALSPVHKIGSQLDEALRIHTDFNKEQRFKRACEMLSLVGIPEPEKRYHQYSFEFSGGMRQRIMIAIALCCNPKLLIADEPTTGLDVTIQAQILELIKRLKDEFKMGVIFITHDLAVVAQNADRVAVMYLGRIVEEADTKTLFDDPKHPYTKALLQSVIGSPLASDGTLQTIKGSVPGPYDQVEGCAFHPRCESCMAGLCDKQRPDFDQIDENSKAACHLYSNAGKEFMEAQS